MERQGHNQRARRSARATARWLLLIGAVLISQAGAAPEHLDAGAWSALIPTDPAQPCELTTGGYDHAADEQDPLLLIVIERGSDRGRLRVNIITPTDLTQPELLRAKAWLRVDGRGPVLLLPAGIVETERERRVTFRPRFPGGEQAGLSGLVDAMRRADRVSVEINGLRLSPAFSMRGLEPIWRQATERCGAAGEGSSP